MDQRSPAAVIEAFRAASPDVPELAWRERLNDAALCRAICETLSSQLSSRDSRLLAYMLTVYTQRERALWAGDTEQAWAETDDLRLCALLVYQLGELHHTMLLWDAKRATFDLWAGLDAQLLVGAGVEPTLAYLQHVGTPEAGAAAEYIAQSAAAGDFVPRDEYIAAQRRYFGF